MTSHPLSPERPEPPEARSTRRRRPWVLGAAALAVAVVAGLAAYLVTPRPASVINGSAATRYGLAIPSKGVGAGLPRLADGRRAPGFDLARLGGGAPVSLAADAGHPVVLNFFASWCPDCRAELKAFATASNGAPSGIRFVGIDTNDHDPSAALALLRAAGDRYPVGMDPSATVANAAYLVEALPVTVFINRQGRIAGQVFGTQTVRSLSPWLRALEAEGPARASGAP